MGTQHAKHVVEGASKGPLKVSFRRQEVIMYILAMSAAESGLFSGSLSERKHGGGDFGKGAPVIATRRPRSGRRLLCRKAIQRMWSMGKVRVDALESVVDACKKQTTREGKVRDQPSQALVSSGGGALTPSLHTAGRTAISRPQPCCTRLGRKGSSGFIYSHDCGHRNQGGDTVLHRWLMPQWRRSSGADCVCKGEEKWREGSRHWRASTRT